MSKAFKFENLPNYANELVDMAALTAQDDPLAMRVAFHAGTNPESNVMVALGDNAAGKSLTRQLIFSHYKHHGEKAKKTFEGIHVSMTTRTGGGLRSAFMYGPWTEAEQSTGVMSLNPLTGAFNTAAGRDHAVGICLDEVEVGLNPKYHHALGLRIAQLHKEHTEGHAHFLGLMVTTHSKELIQGLLDGLGYTPAALMFGSVRDLTVDQWLKAPFTRATLDQLLALPEIARENRKNFSTFLSSK